MWARLRNRRCLAGPQSGQGLVEYLLLLIVLTILILSLLYQFHSSFRKYAEVFFDGYIACLLETGALPGTGSECQGELAAFDGKSGKMLLKNNLASNTNGRRGAATQTARNNRTGNRGEILAGSRNSTPVGSVGRGDSPRVARLGASESGEGGSSGNEYSSLNYSNYRPVGRVGDNYRPSSVNMSFTQEGGIEEKKENGKPTSTKSGKAADDRGGLRPRRATENFEQRKISSYNESENSGFSFGGLLRMFIIIILIVGMVVLFGGQILQILRSREKGGGGD